MLTPSKRLSDIPFSFYYSQLSFDQPSSVTAACSSTLGWSVLLSSVLWEPLAAWTLVSQQPRLYLASQRGVTQDDSLWVRVSVVYDTGLLHSFETTFIRQISNRGLLYHGIIVNPKHSNGNLYLLGICIDLNKFCLRLDLWFIRRDQWDPMRSSIHVHCEIARFHL